MRALLYVFALSLIACRTDPDKTDTADPTEDCTFYADQDMDGYGDPEAPSVGSCGDDPSGFVLNDDDCDDTDAAINPAAPELCNGIDDDCDGAIDEDATDGATWYADADGDGYGDASVEERSCAAPSGFVEDATDCDDADPETHPGAPERCEGVDNDCDGEVDEDLNETWYADTDSDGYGDPDVTVDSCDPGDGWEDNAEDCDDSDPAIRPGADEACNGVDDDCDGEIDEELQSDWFQDADGDGYGDPEGSVFDCWPGAGWVNEALDCDDANSDINPDAVEQCDLLDNDCDGLIDDEDPDVTGLSTWYMDADGDGYGNDDSTLEACALPSGYAAYGGDCDDGDAAVNPGATERCNEQDDDCDGLVDEDDPDLTGAGTWYVDSDGDGYGNASYATTACDEPTGYVADSSDCDDGDASTYPTGEELCDGADNDCDGSVDEADASDAGTWYQDSDGDGYGDVGTSTVSCTAPAGFITDASDCDDGDAAVNPAAEELCDTIDNDCDGLTDGDDPDVADQGTWYADTDGDGYGDASAATEACTAPSGTVTDVTDCDDADASINPAAVEVCDGADNDCDGTVDEDDAADVLTWYADDDDDGYGDAAASTLACAQPSGHVSDASDCDDDNNTVYPGATEHCDGLDNDCDGDVDEDATLTWYADADGDGYGDASTATEACTAPSGTVTDDRDCDDTDADINPAADEDLCNGLDDDCDGDIDESSEPTETVYADADGDGYGDPSSFETGYADCLPSSGYVWDDTDCDDTDPATYPGADEACDGVDQDCDGVADLIGYWPFEAGSGSVAYDDGPLELDGEIIDATWTTGIVGGALDFDGSSAHVLLDHADLAPEEGLTLSAWVSPDSLLGSSWDTVISRGAMGTGGLGCCGDSYWFGYYLYGLALYNNVSSSITDSYIHDNTDYSSHIGGWHHLVGTWDSSSGAQAIYLDGALVASGTAYTYVVYDGAPTRIGADTNSGYDVLHFDGLIDEVKVLECALDASQVAADYADNWPF